MQSLNATRKQNCCNDLFEDIVILKGVARGQIEVNYQEYPYDFLESDSLAGLHMTVRDGPQMFHHSNGNWRHILNLWYFSQRDDDDAASSSAPSARAAYCTN